ncbi:hypothetical protein K439DRAFT_1282426, partial [Ramaria rubella]
KFTIMYMLWMSNVQELFQMKLNVDYTPMDCFKPGIEWKRQGKQADLRKFNLGMSNKHSNSASRIHNHVGPHIFNCQPDQFSRPEWRYENCQELIGWQAGMNGPAFYSPLAPILYCNYKGWHDVKKVFLNQSLFDVGVFSFSPFLLLIVSLDFQCNRGPGALNQEPGAKSTKGAVTNNIIWELKEVTLGAIAASAIFACFALSNDLSFQHQGSASGIDYKADFNTYLKYLISSRTQNRHSVKQIFSIWNNYFFP